MMGIPEIDRPKIRDLVNNLTDASTQQDPNNAFQTVSYTHLTLPTIVGV